jgi:hypothetical protein
MTIEQIANKIIEKLKSLPDVDRHKGKESDFKCFWDEYKEQIQYQLYPNYDIFEENIKSLADDGIEKLTGSEIRTIFRVISSSYNPYKFNAVWEGPYENNYKPNLEDKKDHIIDSILSHIQKIAGEEVVEYDKPFIEYIRYTDNELNVIAEVLGKLSPWEYSIHIYSQATGPEGKQEIVHLPNLKKYNGIERITIEEFEREKKNLNAKRLSPVAAAFENESQANKLLNNENKKDCLITQKDQLNNPDPVLENNVVKEKAQVAKAVKDLVILTAKATKKTPLEVIREMKRNLNERKVRMEHQAQLIEQQGVTPSIKLSKNENEVGIASQETAPNNPNVDLDPETMQAGITLSGILIESGTIKFEDYVRAMIADIGPEIKPYLKMFYNAIRDYPGFNTEGMDDYQTVVKFDIE